MERWEKQTKKVYEDEEENYNAHVECSYTYINTAQIPCTNANTFEMLQANNSSSNNGRIKTDLKPCLVNVKRCIELNTHIMKQPGTNHIGMCLLGFENIPL